MEKSKLVSKQTLSTHTVRVGLDFVCLFATKTDHTFFSSFYDVHLMSKFFKKMQRFTHLDTALDVYVPAMFSDTLPHRQQ